MTMDIRHDHKQQLEGLMEHLFGLADHATPSKVDWDEMSLALREDAIFLREYVLPKIKLEPRYTGTGPRIAEFDVPERPSLEVHADDSSASLVRDDDPTRRFLAQGNGANP